jgi:hypothetical protein
MERHVRIWNLKIAEYIGWKPFQIQEQKKRCKDGDCEWINSKQIIQPLNFHKDYNQTVEVLVFIANELGQKINIGINPQVKESPIDVWYKFICNYIENKENGQNTNQSSTQS